MNTNPKSQNSKRKSFGHWLLFGIWCLVLGILTSGCAGIKETTRGIMGISTSQIENSRKDALKKEFNYEYKACYNKTLEILTRIGAYVYTQDQKKNLIAIYVSEQDTTTVGIFFKQVDANHTQVEVSSPSTYAKELIAKQLFLGLEKSLDLVSK